MKIGIVVTLVALVSIGTAFAHPRTVPDANEGNFIDIEAAVQRHPREAGYRARLVSFKVDTYSPFTNDDLQQSDYEGVAIGVSTDADRWFERVIVVRVQQDSSGHSPYAIVTAGKRQSDADLNRFTPRRDLVGYAKVSRPTNDSVRIVVPVRMLKKSGLNRFRWQLRFVSEEPGSGATEFDYVPNSRLARGHTRG